MSSPAGSGSVKVIPQHPPWAAAQGSCRVNTMGSSRATKSVQNFPNFKVAPTLLASNLTCLKVFR